MIKGEFCNPGDLRDKIRIKRRQNLKPIQMCNLCPAKATFSKIFSKFLIENSNFYSVGLAEKVNGREAETGEGNGDGDGRWRLGMEMETEEKDGDGRGG